MENNLEFIKHGFELKKSKSYKQAIEMFYKALELENNNVEVLFQLGELYFMLHNFERAEHYFNQTLKFNSTHQEALKFLCKIYFISDKFEDAMNYARKLVEINQNSENIILIIDCASKLQDKKTIENLEKYQDLNVQKRIAKAYYDMRCPNEALKILENFKNDTEALIILGKIYFDRNEIEKAKEIFLMIKNCNDNSDVLNFLGLFAIDDGELILTSQMPISITAGTKKLSILILMQ